MIIKILGSIKKNQIFPPFFHHISSFNHHSMEQEFVQLREEEDKSNLTYFDPHFIAVFGGLNEHNVMKYFSTSVFYDNRSLNACMFVYFILFHIILSK